MAILQTFFGSNIGKFYPFAYWAVKLRSGPNGNGDRWISEVDSKQLVVDVRKPFIDKQRKNTYDWTMDLITTSDILRVKELWMFCPPNNISPKGNTATISFTPEEAGTAFHFNVSLMQVEARFNHKIIGKVLDKGTGDCVCYIWDGELQVMSTPWFTNVNSFASWRDGVAPIGKLSHEVIGLRGVSETFYR